MPVFNRFVGTVSQNVLVFFPDATVSTGVGLQNIVASTVRLSWFRSDATGVSSYTLTTGTLGSFTGSTMTQLQSTSTAGWYQVSLPDSLFVSGDHAMVHLMSSTATFAPVPLFFDLSTQVRAISSLVGTSSVTTPVGVTTGVVGVSSATIPFGVSTGVLGVSSATIPFGVSSISTPVAASSLSIPVSVSSISIPVAVSAVTIPLSVSSGSVAVTSAAQAVYNAAADTLLGRNVSGGTAGGRSVSEALYVLRNKVDAAAGIVYQTDDTTSSWGFAVTTQAGNPIAIIDPA